MWLEQGEGEGEEGERLLVSIRLIEERRLEAGCVESRAKARQVEWSVEQSEIGIEVGTDERDGHVCVRAQPHDAQHTPHRRGIRTTKHD